jgi:gluconate 2-dehydrogenase gamma chain
MPVLGKGEGKMKESSGRRRFLKGLGALGAAGSFAPAAAQSQTPPHTAHPAQPKGRAARGSPAAKDQVLAYFTAPEAEFVEAAVARLIPADELGPGAKEAGVAIFIDRQLAGAWGTMARNYRLGPWPEGTPQQGYQSRLTPQEVYRAAIRETNGHCSKKYGKPFNALAAAQQDEVLRELDEGKLVLESTRAQLFFNLLLGNTIEGFFSDPIYGGNRDKIGWKLVGFPGVAAVYTGFIDKHNVPYRAQPVGIGDIRNKRAQVDEHGHAVHILLTRKD